MRRFGRVTGFVSDRARQEYLDAYDRAVALSPVPLTPLDLRSRFGTTRVHVAGPDGAPPLVLLPSKHGTGTVWLDLLPELATAHRLYLVDTLGEVGRSVPSRMLVRRTDVVTWLDSLLDETGIDRCALGGMSIGAYLTATYALARPDRVERLVLLSPAAVAGRIRLGWWRAALPAVFGTDRVRIERFLRMHVESQELTPAARANLDQTVVGMYGMRAALREAMPRNFTDAELARLTMPVLVVLGERELLYDARGAADRLRRVLPSAQVEVLADCGHIMTADQPARVASLLTDFLAREPRSAESAT